MPADEFFIPIVVLIGIFIAIFAVIWIDGLIRWLIVRRWAKQRGWECHRRPAPRVVTRLADFSTLATGCENARAENLCVGDHGGRTVYAFDWRVEDDITSAVVVEAEIVLEPLMIRSRRGTLKREASRLLLESNEFNTRFDIESADRRWAFDVLHPRAMQALLDAPDFTIEMRDTQLMLSRDQVLGPLEFDRAIDLATTLLDLIPGYVRADRQKAAQPTAAAPAIAAPMGLDSRI